MDQKQTFAAVPIDQQVVWLHSQAEMYYCVTCVTMYKGYSIWDPEGGRMENFADPLTYLIFSEGMGPVVPKTV